MTSFGVHLFCLVFFSKCSGTCFQEIILKPRCYTFSFGLYPLYLHVGSFSSVIFFETGNFSYCWPYILGVAGIFMMLTMGAVLVTEGFRKIKLQYYGFKLASGAG